MSDANRNRPFVPEEFLAELAEPIVDDGGPAGFLEEAEAEAITTDDVPVDEAKAIGPAKHVEMTILAQDPFIRDADNDGRLLRAQVRVGLDRFRQPFQTHRFHVVSYDPATAGPGPDLRLVSPEGVYVDRFTGGRDETLLASHDFHAQNAFAIANRTLSAFEAALGRRVPWDFGSHQLYIVPHGEIRANAFYSPAKRALIFGYAPQSDGRVLYSCLSHDVIAHETAHAILDGLRPWYFTPALPDQGAFHEGFADVVALLSVFSVPRVVQQALGKVDMEGLIGPEQVSRKALEESLLLQLAEQFGEAIHGKRGQPLRHSVKLPPGGWWRTHPDYREVHNRGEILVAPIANALLDMWLGRLVELLKPGKASRVLVAQEGAKSAEHLLRMCIRAIDYCPPIEFEFEDFLDGLFRADEQLAPDDEHHYRDTIVAAFARYDIHRPRERKVDVAKLPERPRYERFNFAALRSDPDEVFRFIWENDKLLGISLDYETQVESVRPAIRVGPDGFVVQETVVTFVQQLVASVAELEALSKSEGGRYRDSTDVLAPPPNLDRRTQVAIYGGGTVIFDQFGRPKLHLHKPLLDWKRQSARLTSLVERAGTEASGALGAAKPFERGEPLAALHRPDDFAGERW